MTAVVAKKAEKEKQRTKSREAVAKR